LKIKFKYIFFLAFLAILYGCNTTKYLEGEETYLNQNKIKYKEKIDRDDRATVEYQVKQRLIQEPNSGFLWIPRHWFYYRDQKVEKENWYWRFIRNNLMETPAIIKDPILNRTKRSMQEYLNTKGYLDAQVKVEIDTGKHYSDVSYIIHPGELYRIDEFEIVSRDSALLSIINKYRKEEYLGEDLPLDREAYQQEVNQIVRIARNHGYPQFNFNFIDLLGVDTTGQRIKVHLTILNPPNKKEHDVYSFGKIDLLPNQNRTEVDTAIRTVNLSQPLDSYTVDINYVLDKIRFAGGQTYSRSLFDQSIQNLSSFDIYRFPNTQIDLDTSAKQVNYRIILQENPRYFHTEQIELFYSNIANVNNQLVGLSGQAGISDRNLFGGGEVLSTNVEGSFELGLNNRRGTSANSYNFNIGFQLRLPRYVEFPIIYSALDMVFPASERLATFKRDAQTLFSLDYQYTQRQSFYTYNSITLKSGYGYRPNENTTIEINHAGVNYWIPNIRPTFEEIIGDNEFFRRRFSQRFITGLLFSNFTYDFFEPPNSFQESYRFIGQIETSGLEVLGIKSIYSALGGEKDFAIRTGENRITFSKFIRVEVDGRYYREFSKNHNISLRMTSGIGLGLDDEGVPYIRQFHLGGPYSIRAFPMRALGPGNFKVDQSFREQRLPFFQTGDFMFEVNAEYRFKMAWILEGALFLDIGNVWNLNDDNPDYNLKLDSYKQIAIGTGYGFRFKFPYDVTLRLDLGYPLRYPYAIRGSQWIFQQDFSNPDESIFGPLQLNFAIGYPF
jgi:outer membrane protein assembly factor BamA